MEDAQEREEGSGSPGPSSAYNKNRVSALGRYGLTVRQYDWLFEEQDGLCRICREPQRNPRYDNLDVDHDHSTGNVRGLLCSRCNHLLGHARDRTDVLRAAVAYLESEPLDIPDLLPLCGCGDMVRSARAKFCEECWTEQKRENGRRNMANIRRQKRIKERGADVSYAAKDRVSCSRGHLYDDENTYLERTKEGRVKRKCRKCRNEQVKACLARRAARSNSSS